MICLGIESTAHTFGIGIIKNKKILANALDMYTTKPGQGIVPMDAAEHHKEVKEKVLADALEKAGIKEEQIDAVAYSKGAGLAPSLLVGMEFARELAKKLKKPLVPVCHQIAHIEIGKMLTGAQDPVVLYTSGANTQILGYADEFYRCFGECMDVGVGNALDKFGRRAGLGFPAGPKIEELARKGSYIELPYVVKGMDLSFSGIITSALDKLEKGNKLEDVCFSLQETVFAMLTEVTERALAHTGKKELLVTGGVAANKRFRDMLEIMCNERKAIFYTVPKEYSGDNGVNIAWTGLVAYESGVQEEPEQADIAPRWRTDDAKVTWIYFYSKKNKRYL
ncbi:MAG: bifunctional N(6)-L-threonylcarbamoyladenine synthase/serine/threonine protein kinase [Candidatus Aenigmatarchaeota archaeon]